MNLRQISLAIMLLCLTFGASAQEIEYNEIEFRWAPEGDQVIIRNPSQKLFAVWDLQSGSLTALPFTLSYGKMARWSSDGKQIGFKLIRKFENGLIGQAPLVCDLVLKQARPLCPVLGLAGNPSFSQDGKIAFTSGTSLKIVNERLEEVFHADLPHYVNEVALSPDGEKIVYNDSSDNLILLHRTKQQENLGNRNASGFGPSWSPDGKRVLYFTMDGKIHIRDIASGKEISCNSMEGTIWDAASSAILGRCFVQEEGKIVETRLVSVDLEGKTTVLWKKPGLVACGISPHRSILWIEDGTYCLQRQEETQVKTLRLPSISSKIQVELAMDPNAREARAQEVFLRGVPYLHQVHCTRLNKAVACGSTSATMVLGYYGKLKAWDFVSSTPFAHTSHLGNYISEKYTYNGVTFDKWGAGSSEPKYGLHGYIWQEPVNTKDNMKKVFEIHGLASSVDWSPTWAKLQQKIDAKHPFVILTAITHSGHYKTVIGYCQDSRTLILHDPYGNKNEGYGKMNGACVKYDWPGYNNGHSNLNTVHCFIYAGGTPPVVANVGTVEDPISIPSFPYENKNTTRTSNGSDIFDRYNASPADEKGREMVYRFTVSRPGTLKARVICDNAVDIDIHLLDKPSSQNCLVRAHEEFSKWIPAGTYYLVCDTFVSNGNEFMGDYTLQCSFTADAR